VAERPNGGPELTFRAGARAAVIACAALPGVPAGGAKPRPSSEFSYTQHPGADAKAFAWRFVRFRGDDVSCMAAEKGPQGCVVRRWTLHEAGASRSAASWSQTLAKAPPASGAGIDDEVRYTWASRDGAGTLTRTFRGRLPAELVPLRDQMARWSERCEREGRAWAGEPSVPRPIGSATMREDGTLVLDLVAREKDIEGEARFVYPPTHEDYPGVLGHLEGLCPGGSRGVPPWPDPPRPVK
jgi:hypothetical protein